MFSCFSSMISMGFAIEAPLSATPSSSSDHTLLSTTLTFDPMEIDTLAAPQGTKRKLSEVYESTQQSARKRVRAGKKPMPTAQMIAIERQERKIMRDCRVIMESAAECKTAAATLSKETAIKGIFFRRANNSGSFNFAAMSSNHTIPINTSSSRTTTMHLFKGGDSQSFPSSLLQLRADKRAQVASAMEQATLSATTEQMLDAPSTCLSIEEDECMHESPLSLGSGSEVDLYANRDTLPDYEDDEDLEDSISSIISRSPSPIFSGSSTSSTFNLSPVPSGLSSPSAGFGDLVVISGNGCPEFIDGSLRGAMRRWNKARVATKKTEKRKVVCKKSPESPAADGAHSNKRQPQFFAVPEYSIEEANDFYDEVISIVKFARYQNKDDELFKLFGKVVVEDSMAEGSDFIGFGDDNEGYEDIRGDQNEDDVLEDAGEDDVLEDAGEDDAISTACTATPAAPGHNMDSPNSIDNESLFATDDVPMSSIAQRMDRFKQSSLAHHAIPAVEETHRSLSRYQR